MAVHDIDIISGSSFVAYLIPSMALSTCICSFAEYRADMYDRDGIRSVNILKRSIIGSDRTHSLRFDNTYGGTWTYAGDETSHQSAVSASMSVQLG